MNVDLAVTLISALFGGGGLGVLFKWNHDRKKAPLERTQILSTASNETVHSALAIAEQARAIANEANNRAAVLETDVSRLRVALGALRDWAALINRDWNEIRHHADPPPLPPEAR